MNTRCNRLWRFTLLSCVAAAAAWAAHRPLLPKPQAVNYRTGALPLSGLSIAFASAPGNEDRFAADELAAAIKTATGIPTPVTTGKTSGPTLILSRTGAIDSLPGPDDRSGADSRESYQINIDGQGGRVTARSSAGLFYAVQTLRQLVEEDAGRKVFPAVEIKDWPSLPYRGFMMDMSHGPLPKEEEIKRQIDFLARWKGNQYFFYSETSIEVKGYPLVSQGARYSQDEVRRIIEYARDRHVDVVPCLEFYGHLHDLFKLERYADLAALPHGGEINPRNAKIEALIKDWVEQLSALFPSPWMHLGLDEPWELEKAGSKAAGGIEPGRLYIDHLKSLTSLVRSLGKRPMFWADVNSGAHIFQKYPELFSQLPKDVIAVPWHYQPEPDYSGFVEPFARNKVEQVVAPGIWCWDEVTPDFYHTFANIDGFLADGRKFGAMGLLNTGWTDAAQVIYRMTLPGMAYGAIAPWQSAPMDRNTFYSEYASQMYPENVAAEVVPALDALSKAQELLRKALGRETIFRLWDDPLTQARLEHAGAHRDDLRQIRLLAEDAQEHLARATQMSGDSYSLPSLVLGARMLDYAGMKYLYALDIASYFATLGKNPTHDDVYFYFGWQTSSRNHSRIDDLMDEISELKELYKRAWQTEYQDYRLASALGRWDAEYEYWRRMQTRFWDLLNTHKDKDALPSLEELRSRS
jgi:hexosaminidase